MRQNLFKNPQSVHIPTPTAVNREGFPAYERSQEEQVVSVLMTGTTSNLFYVNRQENIAEMLAVLRKCEDTVFLRNAVVYAREKGLMRVLPIAGLVELSTRNVAKFREIAPRVCRTPHDWKNFLDIVRSHAIRKGMGRGIKKAVHEAIKNMSDYHAVKYPQAVRDMVKLSRPKEEINRDVLKYVMDSRIPERESLIQQLELLKHVATAPEAARIIRTSRLPYEVVVGACPANLASNKEVKAAMMYVAPYQNMLQHLADYARSGLFEDRENVEYIINTLTNPTKIKKSMLFPFRFWDAWRYTAGIVPYDVHNAIQKALLISIENVDMLDGTIVAIASDCSGSMASNTLADQGKTKCIDLVGLFTAMLMQKCVNRPVFLPFSDVIRTDVIQDVEKAETVMRIIEAISSKADGGTSLSAPFEFLRRNKVIVDRVIAFTDNEEWVGKPAIQAMLDYRELNPKVRVDLVTLLPGKVPVPPSIENVNFLYGWSDYILRCITSSLNQVQEVKNYIK